MAYAGLLVRNEFIGLIRPSIDQDNRYPFASVLVSLVKQMIPSTRPQIAETGDKKPRESTLINS